MIGTMMMKRICAGLLVGALVALIQVGANAESPVSALTASQQKLVKKAVGYFDTIVFGAEYDKKQAATIVYKWQGPARIYMQYSGVKPNPKYRQFISKHIKALGKLTRLPVVIVGIPKVANIKIIFIARNRMGKLKLPQVSPQYLAKLAAPGGCYFVAYKSGPRKKQKGRIHSSIIVVNAGQASRWLY